MTIIVIIIIPFHSTKELHDRNVHHIPRDHPGNSACTVPGVLLPSQRAVLLEETAQIVRTNTSMQLFKHQK